MVIIKCKVTLFTLFSILIFTSCKVTESPYIKDREQILTNSTNNEKKDFIAFLSFEMLKEANQNKVYLLDKELVAGSMRNDNPNLAQSKYYLTVEIYENDNHRETFYLDHPLYRRAEYADENSTLKTQTIELDKSSFFVRFQVKQPQTYIVIKETTENKENAYLLTLNLN